MDGGQEEVWAEGAATRGEAGKVREEGPAGRSGRAGRSWCGDEA